MRTKRKLKFKKNSKLIFEEVDGKVHFLDEVKDTIITINETAAIIWKNINSSTDQDKLVDILIKNYKVTRGKASIDVKQILTKFEKLGLIIKSK